MSPASTRTQPQPSPVGMDTVGRTTAITVISTIRPWWALFLRFNFWRVRLMRRLTGPSRIDRALKSLSFIHFAHWAVWRPPKRPNYLLFHSNFNGGSQEYIEAFSMTVRNGMRALWGGAYGVPPPTPVGPFIEYIQTAKIPTTYYYDAYPEASTSMVCAALELRGRFESFNADAAELDADRFADAYMEFVTEATQKRSTVEPSRGTSPAGKGLCAITPIAPDAEEPLRAAIAALPTGEESPFAAIAGTHFARFVVVPFLKDRRGHQLDATSYLLFAAEFDGSREEYTRNLAAATALRAVWRHCDGCPEGPGASAFAEYLLEHRVEAGYSVIGYPGATLPDVRESLALEKRLDDFFRSAQGLEPSELRRSWLHAFDG